MITREEWLSIPLEARLTEHANHCEDELLRDDLLAAIKKLDWAIAQIEDLGAEIVRLERIAASPTPY
jgi:hypothetical protein